MRHDHRFSLAKTSKQLLALLQEDGALLALLPERFVIARSATGVEIQLKSQERGPALRIPIDAVRVLSPRKSDPRVTTLVAGSFAFGTRVRSEGTGCFSLDLSSRHRPAERRSP